MSVTLLLAKAPTPGRGRRASGSPNDGGRETIGLHHTYGTGIKHVRHVNTMRVDPGDALYAFSQCFSAATYYGEDGNDLDDVDELNDAKSDGIQFLDDDDALPVEQHKHNHLVSVAGNHETTFRTD